MKNTDNKYILLASLVMVFALGGVLWAENPGLRYPVDNKGYALEADYAKFSIAESSTTTETVICSGNCILYGILLSSGATGSYAVIRDTATADASGDVLLPNLFFTAGANVRPLDGLKPMFFTYGISIDISDASTGEHALVIYRDVD